MIYSTLKNMPGLPLFPFWWFWLLWGPEFWFAEFCAEFFKKNKIAKPQININVKTQKQPKSMKTTLRIPSIITYGFFLSIIWYVSKFDFCNKNRNYVLSSKSVFINTLKTIGVRNTFFVSLIPFFGFVFCI